MNAQRRATLAELRDRLSRLQDEASDLVHALGDVLEEEEAYLDNMPESLQEGEKGQKAQAAIDLLQTVVDDLTTFTDIDPGDLDTAAE